MNKTKLYGIAMHDLEEAKTIVEQVLGHSMRPHDSSYRGGFYWRVDLPNEASIVLRKNYSAEFGDWKEAEFQEFPLLLYISPAAQSEQLLAMLDERNNVMKLLR